MNEENKSQAFTYSYSAKEREEINRIREKYSPTDKKESKIETLRRLDDRVNNKATAVALILGVLGALIMGTGMSLLMTELGDSIGDAAAPVGVAVGIIGMIMTSLAYPVYNLTLKRERKKVAPEILRISDELMK